MSDDATRRRLLANKVKARRVHLGMRTQAQLASTAGVSLAPVRALEQGVEQNFQAGTSGPIEAVLGWEVGSIDAILAGGNETFPEEEGSADDETSTDDMLRSELQDLMHEYGDDAVMDAAREVYKIRTRRAALREARDRK